GKIIARAAAPAFEAPASVIATPHPNASRAAVGAGPQPAPTSHRPPQRGLITRPHGCLLLRRSAHALCDRRFGGCSRTGAESPQRHEAFWATVWPPGRAGLLGVPSRRPWTARSSAPCRRTCSSPRQPCRG